MYKSGDIVEGKVTGIQPYGAFVALDNHASGLIHISEISDGFVKDISRFVSIGETVRVKVMEYDPATSQARLSLKALQKTHSRNRRRPAVNKAVLPPMRIGFRSIANHMDEWVKTAEKTILHRR
ncbi:MAG TPA: RNA-binding protein [Erysipelotrichaceae bacterium]|nr:RNA-binding protein [Erysipelotrichaceae bacterium]